MDLLPPIAFGDLAHSSLAEVMAAGFRANATGTVAVEQGAGESRLFLRYGIPCGMLLYDGARRFSDYLVSLRLLDVDRVPHFIALSTKKKLRFGELLVAEGVLSQQRMPELVEAHHRDLLARLCLLREGKYELRGWERPPEWTETIRLNPLRALVTALAADELLDRRQALLGRLGRRALHVAEDIDDVVPRLTLDQADAAFLDRLRQQPLSVRKCIDALDKDEAEALAVSYVLLGLIVPEDMEPPPDSADLIEEGFISEEMTLSEQEVMALLSKPIEVSSPVSLHPYSGPLRLPPNRVPGLLPTTPAPNRKILEDIESLIGDDLTGRHGAIPIDLTEAPGSSPEDIALVAARESAQLEPEIVEDDQVPLMVEEAAAPTVFAEPPIAEPLVEEPAVEELVADDSGVSPLEDLAAVTPEMETVVASLPSLEPPRRPLERAVREVSPAPTIQSHPPGPPAAPPPGPEAGDPGQPRASGTDVRRRLLQRAFRNVAPPLGRDEANMGVRAPDPVAAPTQAPDVNLERDLKTLVAQSVTQDHFARLGLERSAGTQQVKDAFLLFVKKYHPDRLAAQGQSHLLPLGRDLFARVKESYDVLVEPSARGRYVAELEAKSGNVKLMPKEARTTFERAVVSQRKKDYKLAETQFARAIEADPQPEFMAELAYTLLINPERRNDAKDEIRSLLVRALKAKPENDRVYVIAAHVARFEGDTAREEKFFRVALEQNPKNVEARQHLGVIERRKGKKR